MKRTSKPKRVRHPNYPWDRWIEKDTVHLRRGKDYSCSDRVMAQQARNVVYRRGFGEGVTVRRWARGITLVFRPKGK